jgi:DNA-binding transcriptional LysR family regulator
VPSPKRAAVDYEVLVGDVQDLRAFTLVADLKSLTAAAKVMGESTATISRRITRLESALEVTLLRRSPRAVETTDDGAAYRARVAEILERLGDANAAARQAHAAPSGQLRVTCAPGLDEVLAPRVVAFAARHPAVSVSLLVSERFVDLDAEHIDIALRATRKLADSTLVAHRLTDLEMIAIAAPAYLETAPALRRLDDLAAHRIVQLGEPRAQLTIALRHSDGSDAEVRVRAAIGANSVGFARELVVAGGGVAILPRLTVRRELDEGRLRHVLTGYSMPGAALYLVHRGGRFLPPKVRAFRDFLVEEFTPGRARRR